MNFSAVMLFFFGQGSSHSLHCQNLWTRSLYVPWCAWREGAAPSGRRSPNWLARALQCAAQRHRREEPSTGVQGQHRLRAHSDAHRHRVQSAPVLPEYNRRVWPGRTEPNTWHHPSAPKNYLWSVESSHGAVGRGVCIDWNHFVVLSLFFFFFC